MAHIEEGLQPDAAEHHVVPVRTYVLVFAALIALTVLTVIAANFDFGGFLNEIVALGIAVAKALLVILFFMHVRSSTPLLRMVVATGFIWFAIMVGFTMSDFVSRDWRSTPPRILTDDPERGAPVVPTSVSQPDSQPAQAPGGDRVVPGATTPNPGR